MTIVNKAKIRYLRKKNLYSIILTQTGQTIFLLKKVSKIGSYLIVILFAALIPLFSGHCHFKATSLIKPLPTKATPLTTCSWQGVLYTTLCDKVCQWLVTGRWFSQGTPVSSTNKTDCHNITEILLKMAWNTINLPKKNPRNLPILHLTFCFTAANSNCLSTDFVCHDRRLCIPQRYVCDNYTNCVDGSDESPSVCSKLT